MAKALRGNSKGVGALEVIIALAILGVTASAFLSGLFTAFRADIIADERSVAQSLAASEMEYVESQDYSGGNWSYTVASSGSTSPNEPSWFNPSRALPSNCDGYSADVAATELDTGLQEISAVIYHNANEVLTLKDYKVDR